MAVTERQKAYLSAMGISVWERRATYANSDVEDVSLQPLNDETRHEPTSIADDVPIYIKPVEPVPISLRSERVDWRELETAVQACQACELAQTRTQTVFGVGNRTAQLLVIGEAPGADEDRQGEPFVGRAGQLLNEMLFAIGFKREDVFIANVLKCRPPNNRDPKPEEMVKCSAFLDRQIELINPKVILAVGRISAQHLLKTETPIGRLRGQKHHFGLEKIPLIVTYHPAYLLRSPLEKRRAWDDLQLALQIYRQTQ